MSSTLLLPWIDQALCHSVVYDELKGDFAQARLIADAALNRARDAGDATSLADAFLARGLVHLLQGEWAAAIRCFEELEQAVPDDYNRRLRAQSYQQLAMVSHFNRLPHGAAAGAAVEVSARWDGPAYLEAEAARRQPVLARTTETSVRLESWLAEALIVNPSHLWHVVQSGRFIGSMVPAVTRAMGQLRQHAEMQGAWPTLLAYLDLTAADLCRLAGDTQTGMQFLSQAWTIYQQSQDAAGLAGCQLRFGDWLVAPFSTPLAWNMAPWEGNSGGSSLSWTFEAKEFGREGIDPVQALGAYDEAERLFRAASSPRGIANVTLRRGYLAMLTGDWAAAVEYAGRAQSEFEACGDRLGYWLAQTHRVLARIGAGQFPEEREIAEAIGAWGASEGSFSHALGLGLLMGRIGRHWLLRGADFERSLACYRLAEALYKALGAVTNQAQSLVDQGDVYRVVGASPAAVTLYEQALDLYAERAGVPGPLGNRATGHAIMLAIEAFQLYERDMDGAGIKRIADRLRKHIERLQAQVRDADSRDGSQIAGLQDAEVVGLDGSARSIVAQSEVLAPLYKARRVRDSGDQVGADRLFSEALTAAKATAGAQRDHLEAVVYGHQRAVEPAREAFERYLARRGTEPTSLDVLAKELANLGGVAGQLEARRQMQRTLEQAFTFMVAIRDYQEARRYLVNLEELAGRDWWKAEQEPWQALSNCGEVFEHLGDPATALQYYDQAIGELEARRSRLSLDELKMALAAGASAQYLYFQAARAALLQAGKAPDTPEPVSQRAQAFAYIERGKARALLDLMAGSAILAGTAGAEGETMRAWRMCSAQLTVWRGLLANERNRIERDRARMAALSQRIDAQEAELRQIETELAQANPDFYQSLNPEAATMTLESVAAALPADTALLQYSFLGEDLIAWAITRQGGMVATHHATVNAKTIGRRMRGFLDACVRLCGDNAVSVGKQLAADLLAPFDNVIRGHSHLVIVPYGPAHALPFHALPWDGDVLAASHTLSYLPSASALQFVSADLAAGLPDRILAIGNPEHMAYRPPLRDYSIPARELRAAETEALQVASLFVEGKALVGGQATKEAVLALIPDYRLLHFATHGILSAETPLLSAILLANGETLSVYELMGVKLDADLVVLSACDTARGEVTGGDDVIGLTRGLLGAGAHAAVVSLWPVDDVSTSLLMGEFYRQIRAEKPPRVALQVAQEYLRHLDPDQIQAEISRLQELGHVRDLSPAGLSCQGNAAEQPDFSHPHHWAPFILIG